MAITERERKILSQLSLRNGGTAFAGEKMEATGIPTLLIGMGGLGGETLNELKRKMRRYMKQEERIEFLVVDTDVNGLNKIVINETEMEEKGNLAEEDIFSLFRPEIIPVVLKKQKKLFAYPEKTENEQIMIRPVDGNGAQGIRQLGHLMFACEDNYVRLKNKIRSKIERLFCANGGNRNQGLDIIFISGLGGGTGSGILIDLPYLVRAVLEEMHIADLGRFSAYFYTPQVLFQRFGAAAIREAISEAQKRNGYAALKELDYYMNLTSKHEKYCLTTDSTTYESEKNVYDVCAIVTQRLAAENGLRKKIPEYLADHLLELLGNAKFENDMREHLPLSYIFTKDRRSQTKAWCESEAASLDPTKYSYQIPGRASVEIPQDEILAYAVSVLYEKLYKKTKEVYKYPVQPAEEILKKAGIKNILSCEEMIMQLLEIKPITVEKAFPEGLPTSGTVLRNEPDMGIKHCMEVLPRERDKIRGKKAREKIIAMFYEPLHQELEQMFINYGPYYVQEILIPLNSVNKDQVFVDGILQYLKALVVTFKGCEAECRMRWQKIDQNQIRDMGENMPVFFARPQIQQYAEFCCQAVWNGEYRTYQFELLADIFKEIIFLLEKEYHEKWMRYTALMEEFYRIYMYDYSYINRLQSEPEAVSRLIHCQESCVENEKVQKLKYYLNSMITPQNIRNLQNALFVSMSKNAERWTEKENLQRSSVVEKMRNIFDGFLGQQLGHDRIEKFILAAYAPTASNVDEINNIFHANGVEMRSILREAAQEIKTRLDQNGILMANPDDRERIDFNSCEVMVFPLETPNLNLEILNLAGVINNFFSAYCIGGQRISCFRNLYSVPLCWFSGVREMEECYRRSRKNGVGIHIDEEIEPGRYPELWMPAADEEDGDF